MFVGRGISKSPLARMAVHIKYITFASVIKTSLIMETEETVDYDWLIEFKKSYRSNQLHPNENKKLGEGEFIALTVEENSVPEKLNDINFGDYIEDMLTRLMEGEQDFKSLIPCNYNSNKKVNAKAA